jgi:hypothetical protein
VEEKGSVEGGHVGLGIVMEFRLIYGGGRVLFLGDSMVLRSYRTILCRALQLTS